MRRLIELAVLILALGASCHACSQAYAETRSVPCRCTGQNVNATVCAGTIDHAWCTEYVDPQYCGSNGGLDCYVGGAEDGCIEGPSGKPEALSRVIESRDHIFIASFRDSSSCAAANLPSIDEWFAARKRLGHQVSTAVTHGG